MVSDNRTMTAVPAVTIWVYEEHPDMCQNVVESVNNLLYADVFYLRMEYDDTYINSYLAELQELEWEANAMKKYMVVMGTAMILAAPFTGGTTAI
jgi:hypothetical protein